MLTDQEIAALVIGASSARNAAYAPYSGYTVGAAVVADADRVFFGCNVENASYSLSLCAERAAIASAIAGGAKEIKALVLITEPDPPGTPCGACLQWLAEFGDDSVEIVTANPNGCLRKYTLAQLLPQPFKLENRNR